MEKSDFLNGMSAQKVEQIYAVQELGFNELQLMFSDFAEIDGIELFGDEVLRDFQ